MIKYVCLYPQCGKISQFLQTSQHTKLVEITREDCVQPAQSNNVAAIL